MTATADFLLPSLGADMESGTIVSWSVSPGDEVTRGDVILIVETDKGEIDVEVWQSGVVDELLVEAGAEVPVGTPLARLRVDESTSRAAPRAPVEVPMTPAPTASEPAATPTPQTLVEAPVTRPVPSRPLAVVGGGGSSPLARRIAAERGIDVTELVGSGPNGAVVARDVPDRPAPPVERPSPEAAMRRAIAATMARANRDIPHYYLALDVDLETPLTWLEERNAERPVTERVLPAALLLTATARALDEHPSLNGWWRDDALDRSDGVHLGVAVSLRGGGLVVPVIEDAGALGLDELMARLRDLVARARTGRLRASEVSGASATVTNLGDRGADVVHGVIHPPQVALIGVGRTAPRPAVVDGELAVRRQATISLAADHRASDGEAGARFLRSLDHHLQTPEEL
jgi:pyruvate dehydrogenase E2 component (dihydrolipoamide acetyltransferase)